MITVALLFQEGPIQWGLRGDPFLWRAMRDHFAHTPLPATAEELYDLIEATFEDLTGHSISSPTHFYIERFSHGGMSSGMISPEFWRDIALPLLQTRYKDLAQ